MSKYGNDGKFIADVGVKRGNTFFTRKQLVGSDPKTSTADTAKGKATKGGLDQMGGYNDLVAAKKRFVSRKRVSAKALKATGFTGFEAQAELVRDWSENGLSDEEKKKRQEHGMSILKDNFPMAHEDVIKEVVTNPRYHSNLALRPDGTRDPYGFGPRASFDEPDWVSPSVSNALLGVMPKDLGINDLNLGSIKIKPMGGGGDGSTFTKSDIQTNFSGATIPAGADFTSNHQDLDQLRSLAPEQREALLESKKQELAELRKEEEIEKQWREEQEAIVDEYYFNPDPNRSPENEITAREAEQAKYDLSTSRNQYEELQSKIEAAEVTIENIGKLKN
jgi:hypothetical protein